MEDTDVDIVEWGSGDPEEGVDDGGGECVVPSWSARYSGGCQKVCGERGAQTTERERPPRSPEACAKARERRTVAASGQRKGCPGQQDGNHLRAE